MGFNLNKLKKQYGVGSAAKLGYAGVKNPGVLEDFNYDKEKVNAAGELISEDDQIANYKTRKNNYDDLKSKYDLNNVNDRAAYDNYSAQYDQRLAGTPMYANKQFAGSKRVAPNTVNEMYEKYLGRENENNNKMYPMAIGYGPSPEERQRVYDDENRQVNDAERNAFIRNADTELFQRGINNTGNQYLMNQSGNYFGNFLGAPAYGAGPLDPASNAYDIVDYDNKLSVDEVMPPEFISPGGPPMMPIDTVYPDSGTNFPIEQLLPGESMPGEFMPRTNQLPDWMIAPPEGSMNTMAMVEHTNPVTGEKFMASNGGYRINPDYIKSQLNNEYVDNLGRQIGTPGLDYYSQALLDNMSDSSTGKSWDQIVADLDWVEQQGGELGYNSGNGSGNGGGNGGGGGNAYDDSNMVAAHQAVLDANRAARLEMRGPEDRYNTAYENNDQGNLMNVFKGAQEYGQGFVNDLSTGIGNYIDTGGIAGALTNLFNNNNDNSLVSSNITDSSYVNPAGTPVGEIPSTAVANPGPAAANITSSNVNNGMGNTLNTVGGLGNEEALMSLIYDQDSYDRGNDNKSDNNTNTVNKYTNSATTGAKSGYRTGLARGGPVKGYREGGPGGEFEVEEETLIAPDTTLEGDPLDMDALVEEATLPTPAMSPNVIAMRKMLQNSQETSQDAGIESLGQEYNTSVGAYQQAMANLAGQESKGPSESEKWFRIAAAFGKPTQSGNFFDGLSNVSGALGDIEAERRAAQSTGNQLLLENSRFGMDLLKEQLATATLLQTDERNYNRNLQELFLTTENERMLLTQERAYDILSEKEKRQWESDNNKSLPQTVAAKAASDLGYKRGDEDYIKYVTDYYEREQARKDLEIKTLADQANRLTKPELDLSVETDKYIVGQNSAIALLEQALELNDKSYTNSLGDTVSKFLKGKIDPTDPKYIATEKLMNVLSKGALATLKATFGGNISDGERAANLDLQGLNSMSLEARRDIIDQALQMMIRERDRNKAKLVKIRDGSYATRDKTVETK